MIIIIIPVGIYAPHLGWSIGGIGEGNIFSDDVDGAKVYGGWRGLLTMNNSRAKGNDSMIVNMTSTTIITQARWSTRPSTNTKRHLQIVYNNDARLGGRNGSKRPGVTRRTVSSTRARNWNLSTSQKRTGFGTGTL